HSPEGASTVGVPNGCDAVFSAICGGIGADLTREYRAGQRCPLCPIAALTFSIGVPPRETSPSPAPRLPVHVVRDLLSATRMLWRSERASGANPSRLARFVEVGRRLKIAPEQS